MLYIKNNAISEVIFDCNEKIKQACTLIKNGEPEKAYEILRVCEFGMTVLEDIIDYSCEVTELKEGETDA